MKLPAVQWLVLFATSVVGDQNHDSTQDNPSLRRRQIIECPDGFSGTNCKENVDECKGLQYPCAGGTNRGSFCVDYNPPEKFKCGCRTGYDAVLPDAIDVKDPVPIEWRPLKCVPRDVCVDFVCHEDATCIVSPSNTAVCVCNDNLIGDGIANCTLPPKAVATKPPSPPSPTCEVDSDCNKVKNSACVEGECKCKAGYYQSSGKGQCLNENECADGYPNDCHEYADCMDTDGSYTCACIDGYQDLNADGKPGTMCVQLNECLSTSLHDCDVETQVCLDRPPPVKWECVERTAAPTPAPTRAPTIPFLCYNDQTGNSPDTGCTSSTKKYCVAAAGMGGNACAFCINDKQGTTADTGCGGRGIYCRTPSGLGGTNCGSADF